MLPQYTPEFVSLIWSKVNRNGPVPLRQPHLGACWEWAGGRWDRGYGYQIIDGKMRGVHRIVWEIVYGSIPDGLWVLHWCDNPPCVRPDHLHLGTPADNTHEIFERNRGNPPSGDRSGSRLHPELVARGEAKVKSAKLTSEQVREIRQLYAMGGISQESIGQRFHINESNVSMIVNRKRWKHI